MIIFTVVTIKENTIKIMGVQTFFNQSESIVDLL